MPCVTCPLLAFNLQGILLPSPLWRGVGGEAFLKVLLHHLLIIEVVFNAFYFLIVLVSLACN